MGAGKRVFTRLERKKQALAGEDKGTRPEMH